MSTPSLENTPRYLIGTMKVPQYIQIYWLWLNLSLDNTLGFLVGPMTETYSHVKYIFLHVNSKVSLRGFEFQTLKCLCQHIRHFVPKLQDLCGNEKKAM